MKRSALKGQVKFTKITKINPQYFVYQNVKYSLKNRKGCQMAALQFLVG